MGATVCPTITDGDANVPVNQNSEAFDTGYEAYKQGECSWQNPYYLGSYNALEWLSGWETALNDEPKKS